MKQTAIEKAVDVLAAEHGRLAADKFRQKIKAALLPATSGTFSSPYSIPSFVNEEPLCEEHATDAIRYSLGPNGSRMKKGKTAGRLRQAAAMRVYWRKRRLAAKAKKS